MPKSNDESVVRKGRYSPEFWEQIFLKYCEGVFISDLSTQFNIKEKTLRNKIESDSWDKRRTELNSSSVINKAGDIITKRVADGAMDVYNDAFNKDVAATLELRALANKTYTNIMITVNNYVQKIQQFMDEQKDTPTKGLVIVANKRVIKTSEFLRDLAPLCSAVNPIIAPSNSGAEININNQGGDGISAPQINIQLVQMDKKIREVEDAIDV
jgi:hypothetical protein